MGTGLKKPAHATKTKLITRKEFCGKAGPAPAPPVDRSVESIFFHSLDVGKNYVLGSMKDAFSAFPLYLITIYIVFNLLQLQPKNHPTNPMKFSLRPFLFLRNTGTRETARRSQHTDTHLGIIAKRQRALLDYDHAFKARWDTCLT